MKPILTGQVCEGLSWLLSNASGLNSPWVVPFPGQVVLNYVKAWVEYNPAVDQAASSQPQWCLLSCFDCEVSSFIRVDTMGESTQACLLPWVPASVMSAISQGWAAIWNSELKLTLSFLKLLLVRTFYHSHRNKTEQQFRGSLLSHVSHFTDPMTSCPLFLLRWPTSCKPVFGLGFLCIIQSHAKSSCPATTKDSSETKYNMVSGVVLYNTSPPTTKFLSSVLLSSSSERHRQPFVSSEVSSCAWTLWSRLLLCHSWW